MTNTTKRKLAVFDIDGTLLNSMPKMHADIIGAFKRLGYEVNSEQIKSQRGGYDISSNLGVAKEDYDREFDKRKSWRQSLKDGEAPIFADAKPCLEKLAEQGVTLAVLTRSLPEYTHAKLDFYGLNKYFQDMIAITLPTGPKSKINEAQDLIRKINPDLIERAYFIGDRAEDVTVAKDIQDIYQLNSSGIYVNRNESTIPVELMNYRAIKSLDEVSAIIGA